MMPDSCRSSRGLFGVGVIVVCALGACGARAAVPELPPQMIRMDGVAAYVNGEPITLSDVIRTSQALQELLSGRGEEPVTPEVLNRAYGEALDELVAVKLVVAAYEDQKRLVIPDAAIEERVNEIVDQQFSGDWVSLSEALTREGLSLERWRTQVRDGIVLQAMRSQHVDRHVRVSPAEVKAAYVAHASELVRPGRVKVRMIVLPDDAALLVQVRERLGAGEAFEAVAREVSTGAYASEGGDRGWMTLPDLREELRNAVVELKAGELSEPVMLGGKIYLLKVEDVVAEQAVSFDEAAPALERNLRAQAAARIFREWVSALRQTAYVRIVEEAPF